MFCFTGRQTSQSAHSQDRTAGGKNNFKMKMEKWFRFTPIFTFSFLTATSLTDEEHQHKYLNRKWQPLPVVTCLWWSSGQNSTHGPAPLALHLGHFSLDETSLHTQHLLVQIASFYVQHEGEELQQPNEAPGQHRHHFLIVTTALSAQEPTNKI